MKILGNTSGGFFIQASNNEIKDLLEATGVKDPNPSLGDTIPIANYIEAEKAAREMVSNYDFKNAKKYFNKVQENFEKFELVFKKQTG